MSEMTCPNCHHTFDAVDIPPDARCDEHFAQHPTRPELVAVCTLPSGHIGDHDNVLPKGGGHRA